MTTHEYYNNAMYETYSQSDWDAMDAWDWSLLLTTSPQFADKCKCWHTFSNIDWMCLLKCQPQFEIYKLLSEL